MYSKIILGGKIKMAEPFNDIFVINRSCNTINGTIWELEEEGYLGYGDNAEGNLFFQMSYRSFIEQEENRQKLITLLRDYRLRVFQIKYEGKIDSPLEIIFYCLTQDETRIMAKIILSKKKMKIIDCDEEFSAQFKKNYL